MQRQINTDHNTLAQILDTGFYQSVLKPVQTIVTCCMQGFCRVCVCDGGCGQLSGKSNLRVG